MRRRLRRAGIALVVAVLALSACRRHPEVVIASARGPVSVRVEVAATPEARAQGLMYRRDLGADAGMLFLFPKASVQRFWMKNTPLPLDMVFIGTDRRIVGIVANTRPFTEHLLGVDAPSQYVLEVHAGFCARHGIAVGDAVEFMGVDGRGQ